jgi:hypothetical protein
MLGMYFGGELMMKYISPDYWSAFDFIMIPGGGLFGFLVWISAISALKESIPKE